jgi:hypothetical protein
MKGGRCRQKILCRCTANSIIGPFPVEQLSGGLAEQSFARSSRSQPICCTNPNSSGAVPSAAARLANLMPETLPMPAPLHHIETTPTLPAEAEAVMIGGGIVGVFAAYCLTVRGCARMAEVISELPLSPTSY